MQRFDAPWCTLLKVVTVLVSCLLLGIGLIIALSIPPTQPLSRALVMLAPFLAIGLAALFTVRSYEVDGAHLKIHRFGWISRFDLRNLKEARVDPESLRRSLRLFGNGGFFSFSGWFRSKSLGVYRFFGTDPERAVVLKFADDRIIVVTPDDPEEFVRTVTKAAQSPAQSL